MDPILGTITTFAFNWLPVGFASCNGQLLNIAQNQALFALLGTSFGGNGTTTFGVPDLRGRTIIGFGPGPNLTNIPWAQYGGTETITLAAANLPSHNHTIVNGNGTTPGTVAVSTKVQTVNNSNSSNETDNGNNGLGTAGTMNEIYRESLSGNDHLGGVTSTINGSTGFTGNGTSVASRNPYVALNCCIATQGIFPSRN